MRAGAAEATAAVLRPRDSYDAAPRLTRRTTIAGAMRIDLSEPCLVVLVGAAGAGKTTLAGRLFSADEVLSSDAHRALLTGDEADQTATKTAFAMLHRRLAKRMAERRTTVVDATNVTSFARRSLVRRAAAHAVPAIAIVLELPTALVLGRNATRRGRIVPEQAVRRQLDDLARSLRRDSLAAEGFAAVHHLRTAAELEALMLRRSTPAGPAAELAGDNPPARSRRPPR
jgi:protein phosphatase